MPSYQPQCLNPAHDRLLAAAKKVLLEYFGPGGDCPTRGTLELRGAIAECENDTTFYVGSNDT